MRFRLSLALALSLAFFALPVQAATLEALRFSACGFSSILWDDYQQCLAGGPCYGDIGALARNGGTTSKYYKICVSRLPNLIAYCDAGNTTAARTTLNGTISAAENMIGQTVEWTWDGQVDPDRVVYWFGGNYVTLGDVFWPPTWDAAKRHVWAVAAGVGEQPDIYWSAVSILAELYRREQLVNVCD